MIVTPTDEYWQKCEQTLRQRLANSPTYMSALLAVMEYLKCIHNECGDNVRAIGENESKVIAICLASKILFDTEIMKNLDISTFLRDTFAIKAKQL